MALIYVPMIYRDTHTHTYTQILSALYFLWQNWNLDLSITLFTTLWSMPYLHLMRSTMPWIFLMNTMTFIKRKWLGRLEKGYKQMFSQSCWNKKVKEIALFLDTLSNRVILFWGGLTDIFQSFWRGNFKLALSPKTWEIPVVHFCLFIIAPV